MRNVDRNSLNTPRNLKFLADNVVKCNAEKDYISNTGVIKKHIYTNNSVKDALQSLYHGVCFLCQKDVYKKFEIEHFLPWSKYFPERAYDWDNLHMSCKKCNSLKKKEVYKEIELDPVTGDKKVLDILLLDPTSDADVEMFINFDPKSSMCIASNSEVKTLKMCNFLNDDEHLYNRRRAADYFTDFIISDDFLEIYLKLKNNNNLKIEDYDFEDEEELKIGEFCYKISTDFINVYSEYNVFFKRVISNKFKLDVEFIKSLTIEFCNYKAFPVPNFN